MVGGAEEQSSLGSTNTVDRIQESRQAHTGAAVGTIVAVGLALIAVPVLLISESSFFPAALRVSAGHRTIAAVSGSCSLLCYDTNISSMTTMAFAGASESSLPSRTSLHLPSVPALKSLSMSDPLIGIEVDDVDVQFELGRNGSD